MTWKLSYVAITLLLNIKITQAIGPDASVYEIMSGAKYHRSHANQDEVEQMDLENESVSSSPSQPGSEKFVFIKVTNTDVFYAGNGQINQAVISRPLSHGLLPADEEWYGAYLAVRTEANVNEPILFNL